MRGEEMRMQINKGQKNTKKEREREREFLCMLELKSEE